MANRVVDDEYADEERQQARDVHHHRVAASIASNCWPRPEGTSTWKTGPSSDRSSCWLWKSRFRLDSQVDRSNVRLRPRFLRRVDVENRQVSPNVVVKPDDFMMLRIVNSLRPSPAPSGRRPPTSRCFFRRIFRHGERIRLREKDEGSLTTASLPLSKSYREGCDPR